MSIHRQSTPYEGVLNLLPPPVLAPLVKRLNHVMRRRHPDLVASFAALDPAVMHVSPTGLRHRFALAFGGGRLEIRLLPSGDDSVAQASIKGELAVLIDLLEGRYDGDAMFFSRELQITGDTAVIVAVRNTLDREELDLRGEVAALFGPLARPAQRIGARMGDRMRRMQAGVAAFHDRLHEGQAEASHHDEELAALRGEVKALRERVAKLTARRMRAEIGLEKPHES
ncbi:SCP2 domain-containing protein [Acidocella sp.]|uniref:ubiquinone anaerobic biosynthesis accessory factor UbiT n=1 Tax=Acidocella sp. TaxID=50710 RepID=UPI0026050AE1|nr:SCP2 sterol-binding domain-containing protein [Acidocella sp.]